MICQEMNERCREMSAANHKGEKETFYLSIVLLLLESRFLESVFSSLCVSFKNFRIQPPLLLFLSLVFFSSLLPHVLVLVAPSIYDPL